MLRVSLIGAALLFTSQPSLAAGPVSVTSAQVFAPPPATDTVAIVRPESGSEAADAALAEGLWAAGYTVVPRSAEPALLVSYVTRFSGVGSGAGGGFVTASTRDLGSSVLDVERSTAVVAWDAGSERPAAGTVKWVTSLRSHGLSRDPGRFLPAMLRAGAAGYGRNLPNG